MAKIGRAKSKTSRGCHDSVQLKSGAHIPDDLISDILLWLPAGSVVRFRCVSRLFRSITSSSSFITAHLQRKRLTHQSLMIEGKGLESNLVFSLGLASIDADDDARITLRKLPRMNILYDTWLLKSCNGLILFYTKEVNLHCITNPLTGQAITLPSITRRSKEFMGFYFHHSTSTYRILCEVKPDKTDVLVVGKNYWRRIHSRRPAFLEDYHCVDTKGSLHWLAWIKAPYKGPPNNVMAFDKETEAYSLLPLPSSENLCDRGGNLMDFNGELGLWVVSDSGVIDFWIMKECWIKRCSIIHPDLEGCLTSINTCFQSWHLGPSVSVNHEELLIGLSASIKLLYLVRWNLKSGACAVRCVEDYSPSLYTAFPFMETLVELSYELLRPCTRSWSQRFI